MKEIIITISLIITAIMFLTALVGSIGFVIELLQHPEDFYNEE